MKYQERKPARQGGILRYGWMTGAFLNGLFLAIAPIPAPAQDQEFVLRPEAWDYQPIGSADCRWEDNAVTLTAVEGAPAAARLISRQSLKGDFDAQVSFSLRDWRGGQETCAALGFALAVPPRAEFAAPGSRLGQVLLQVGRKWTAPWDLYEAAGARRLLFGVGEDPSPEGDLWRPLEWWRSSAATADLKGRLRLLRRGGQVEAAYQTEGEWEALQQFDAVSNQDVGLLLAVSNVAEPVQTHPTVQVRFSDLDVQFLAAPRRPTQVAPPGEEEWVIYSTGPGWLRVGPRAEFQAEWQMRHEIGGGESTDPLPKELLREGFTSREEALKYLCDHLTRVVVSFAKTLPYEVVKALFEKKEYLLRLDWSEEYKFDYDFAAEKKVLREHGLTPRADLGKQWLVHSDEGWLLDNEPPAGGPDPDYDRWEGPYRDNYGLARAMKRLGVPEVDFEPPEGEVLCKIIAAEVPDEPRDYGPQVLGVQPIVDPPVLRDWVVYVTADRWLHIGTRQEFETPVAGWQTIWGGTSEEPLSKREISLGPPSFPAYELALRALCPRLTNVQFAFNPLAEPQETIVATLEGKDYYLQLHRDPDTVVASYRNYWCGSEQRLLLEHGIAPIRKFGNQRWLVHATGHGTRAGPVKDDEWMLVAREPRDGRVLIADGRGGTFTYAVDVVEGPFEDNLALIPAMKKHNLKYVPLQAGRFLSVDEALPSGPPARPEPPRIISITPDRGEPGTSFYVTLIAVGMKPWYNFHFGDGVIVTDPTCLGINPDGEGERWLATLSISENTQWRAGQ